MSKRALVLGGVVMIGAAIGLWVLLRGGDAPASPGSAERAGGSEASRETPTPTDRQNTDTPSLPPGTVATPGASGDYTEYTVGGRKVRDHRKGNRTPIDLPPSISPPTGRKIQPTLTAAVGNQMRDVMHECAASIPQEARGERPRLDGLVVISIKDHVLSVGTATVQLRDVVGASVAPVKQCIEDKARAITQPAPDEGDLPTYDITISFTL